MAFFEVKNLKVNHKSFQGKRRVLDIDSIKIDKGTTYGIVGESGQGKTVLALSILRLLQCPPGEIESGQVLFDGEDLMKRSARYVANNILGKRLAMIFQDPMSSLNPVFTVGSQMVEVIRRHKGRGTDPYKEAMSILGTVRLPDSENVFSKYPHELSGGQRQRIIIALALLCGAELLIADEPTRNLDVTTQASIIKLLKELQADYNLSVLFIANNLSLVSAFCDHVGVLSGGKIIEQGGTKSLIDSPREEYTKLLIKAADIRENGHSDEGAGDIILKVENLTKYFDVTVPSQRDTHFTLKAVDGVSFDLGKGEVLGIVGESGCGKSTLVNTILRLYEPTGGTVHFQDEDISRTGTKALRRIRKNIQIVFQDPYWSLNPRLLVRDLISEPIEVHENLSAAQRLEKVEDLLGMVGLPKGSAFKYPHEFSGGERQRIAIARSLAVQPKMVVLDEPTSAIDIFSQAQILELLQRLRKELDLTMILISHDLGVVSRLAGKIMVMYLGKVVEFGPAQEVFREPKHPYTRALFDSIPSLKHADVKHLATLEGELPSSINLPRGCRFHTRCRYRLKECETDEPCVTYLTQAHYVACHLYSGAGESADCPKGRVGFQGVGR